MPTVTLSGYYGYGNAGDEAVLAGLIQGLRAQCPPLSDLDILVLSGAPTETSAVHGVRAADRYKAGDLMRALTRTDLLMSGGGSLLQDVTSAHSIFYYLGVVRMAQLLGKRTMFAAQGIGPLVRQRTRRLVCSVANRLTAITVRDKESAQLLEAIGVNRPSIEVTADPALLLSPKSFPLVFTPSRFAVALRPWRSHSSRIGESAAHAASLVLSESECLLLPMQPQQDGPLMEHFARLWHQQCGGPVRRLDLAHSETLFGPLDVSMKEIAACHMMVGMRLHALILATACAVPSVALSYDPKVTAFMAQCGQADAVYDLENESPDLTLLMRQVWAERTERAAALRERIPHLQARALRNAEVAAQLLM